MKKANNPLLIVLCAGFLLFSCGQKEERQVTTAPSQTDEAKGIETAKREVREVLQNQSACWSRGDLECYMADYWKSDSLLFVGKSGLTYGWQQTLDNYRKNYPDTSAMGKLEFELKEMRPLSAETMLVVGKWHLQREAKLGDLEGHFSVIFKHFPEGWKIIADHSS